MRPKPIHLLSLFLVTACLVACGEAPPAQTAAEAPAGTPPTEPPDVTPLVEVAALSHPVHWLASRLGGAEATVVLVPPATADPSFWQPSPETVVELADADLILMSGAGYEGWTAQASLPPSRLISAAENVETIETPGTTHSHGPAGEHSHGEVDPYVWMDPLRYAQQASVVAVALSARAPTAEDVFERRLEELRAELEALDGALAEALAPLAGLPMAADHASYRYLAERYGLDLTVLDLDPATPPDAAATARVAAWAEDRPRPVLWWHRAPSPAVRDALPASVRHVYVDPLDLPPPDGPYDYLAQARENLTRFRSLAASLAEPAPADGGG